MSEKKFGTCPKCNAPCEVTELIDVQGFDGVTDTTEVPYDQYKYHPQYPQHGAVWVKASERLPQIVKPTKLIVVKRYEGVPDVFSVRAMTPAQFADMVKYDLANFEWLDEGTAAGREEDLTADDIVFLNQCSIYIVSGGLQVMTENDEGGVIQRDEVSRLIEILNRCEFKQKEK